MNGPALASPGNYIWQVPEIIEFLVMRQSVSGLFAIALGKQ